MNNLLAGGEVLSCCISNIYYFLLFCLTENATKNAIVIGTLTVVVLIAVIAGSVVFFKRGGKQEMQTKQQFIDPNKQKYFVIYN